MIELNINDMKDTERHSSKGNQLKWNPANTETWYKADYWLLRFNIIYGFSLINAFHSFYKGFRLI